MWAAGLIFAIPIFVGTICADYFRRKEEAQMREWNVRLDVIISKK